MIRNVLLFCILSLTSCASDGEYTGATVGWPRGEEAIAENPDCPPEVKEAIRNEEIFLGMTQRQVYAAWGKSEARGRTWENVHNREWRYTKKHGVIIAFDPYGVVNAIYEGPGQHLGR